MAARHFALCALLLWLALLALSAECASASRLQLRVRDPFANDGSVTKPQRLPSRCHNASEVWTTEYVPAPQTLKVPHVPCKRVRIRSVGEKEKYDMFMKLRKFEAPHLPFGDSLFTCRATAEHPMKLRITCKGEIHGVHSDAFHDHMERVMDFCQKWGYGVIVDLTRVTAIHEGSVDTMFDGMLARSRNYAIPINVYYNPNHSESVLAMRALTAKMHDHPANLLFVTPYPDNDPHDPSTGGFSN